MSANETQDLTVNPRNNFESLAGIAEKVLLKGDLSDLTPAERVFYYNETCRSLGLNPLTKPFDYIPTEQGLKLYPNKDCAAQLRSKYGVSLRITSRESQGQMYVVTVQAQLADRTDESVGAVALVKEQGEWKTGQNGKKYFVPNGQTKALSPEAQANAVMRAETKAKRRATLSICGLGMFDMPDGAEAEDAPRWDFDVTPLQPAANAPAATAPTNPPPADSTGDAELDRELLQFTQATREQRLAKFSEMKKALGEMSGDAGEALFFQILKDNDAEDPAQLKNMRQAKAAFAAMWRALREGVPAEEEPAQ